MPNIYAVSFTSCADIPNNMQVMARQKYLQTQIEKYREQSYLCFMYVQSQVRLAPMQQNVMNRYVQLFHKNRFISIWYRPITLCKIKRKVKKGIRYFEIIVDFMYVLRKDFRDEQPWVIRRYIVGVYINVYDNI